MVGTSVNVNMSMPLPYAVRLTMPTTVYRSRSRTTRNRLLIAAAVVALVLLGFLIGRWQDDAPALSAPPPPSSAAPPPSPSRSPAPPVPGALDAYRPLQVEDAAAVSGLEMQDTADEGGGRNAGWINNGDWLRFDGVDFGADPPAQVNLRVAADVPPELGGRVEIRLDSPDAGPSAVLETSGTGGWQNWRTEAAPMTPVTGVHTVFVTFANDRPDDFINVNWLVFRRPLPQQPGSAG